MSCEVGCITFITSWSVTRRSTVGGRRKKNLAAFGVIIIECMTAETVIYYEHCAVSFYRELSRFTRHKLVIVVAVALSVDGVLHTYYCLFQNTSSYF